MKRTTAAESGDRRGTYSVTRAAVSRLINRKAGVSAEMAVRLPDEGSGYAEGILVAPEGKAALVPAIWPMEIANALSVAERNKRLSQPDVRRFLTLLRSLSLITDAQPVG